jgi:hypothetical protein
MKEPLQAWSPTMGVTFADLDFSEGAVMPKLRGGVGNAVFFLYRLNPETGEREGPCGTGFMVGRRSKVLANFNHYYGVTNWHNSHEAGASIIRINTDTSSRYLDYGPEDWHFVQGSDDLSIIDLTDQTRHGDQVAHYTDAGFVDRAFIKRFEVDAGEDVFMMGLFADQHGGDRNTPAARFGNLSLLADERAPIEQPNGSVRPCHLVDMRSRTGFSGSPVSIYRIPGVDLSDIPAGPPKQLPPMLPGFEGVYALPKFVTLLGVHCGQYFDEVKVFKTRPKPHERVGDPIHEGDKLYIQSGMTIVIPAWRITEMLDLEVFEMARRKREERLGEVARRRPQPESVEVPTTPATDGNPKHREDFNSLLGAAVKKPERED